jgi:predicted transglutaminase-like cysteine proteinase
MRGKLAVFISLLCMPLLFPEASFAWDTLMGAHADTVADEQQAQLWQHFAPRWKRVLRKERERPVFAPGGRADFPPRYAELWKNALAALEGKDEMAIVSAVCGFMDTQFARTPDMKAYNRPEHWASPAEMTAKGAGDSEDFAFIKYFALRSLGFKAEDLRVLLVDLPEGRGDETRDILLAVRIKDAIYVQDSTFRPAGLLLPANGNMTTRYRPLAAFNEDGVLFYR